MWHSQHIFYAKNIKHRWKTRSTHAWRTYGKCFTHSMCAWPDHETSSVAPCGSLTIGEFVHFHRFYLRSSLVFQLIFVGCWLCAYLYMVNLHSIYDSIGTATYMLNDDSTKANIMVYGYGFVVLNVVQGTFILVFHCMQNEKVKQENNLPRRFGWRGFHSILVSTTDSTRISKVHFATFVAAAVSFMRNWNDWRWSRTESKCRIGS